MRLLLLVPLFGLVACKRPPEAPQALDDLVGYLYAHHQDEEPDAMEAGTLNLSVWLDANIDETMEGYTVNNLSQEAVDALDDGERDLSGLNGAAVGHISTFRADDVGVVVATTEPTEVYPDTYTEYTREFKTDPACFVNAECEFLEFDAHSTTDWPLGLSVTTDTDVQFRWVETDLGLALIQRSWLHEAGEVNVDWLTVDQEYYLWAFLPTADGGHRNVQATWIVATLSGSSVPENAALQLVIGSMSKTAETLDEFLETR